MPLWRLCTSNHVIVLSHTWWQDMAGELCWRATPQNAKHGQPFKKANPLHNLYIMPAMALQTSTYHLQNDKHNQLHLYRMPYWTEVDLEKLSKIQKISYKIITRSWKMPKRIKKVSTTKWQTSIPRVRRASRKPGPGPGPAPDRTEPATQLMSTYIYFIYFDSFWTGFGCQSLKK